MLASILEILGWIGFSIIKFLFVPSLMVVQGWKFHEIILIHTTGSTIAIVVFYYFGQFLFDYLKAKRKREKKVFSKGKRRIIHVKNKYDLLGLLAIGILLSPAVTAFLAGRYFPARTTLLKVILAFVIWSIIITSLSFLIPTIF